MSDSRQPLSRPESLHLQVARQIRTQIAAGKLRDGQRLPSTRELATEWSVSGFTIQEAMKILEAEGAIISKPRAGRVVHAPEQRQRGQIKTTKPNIVLIGGYAGSGKTEFGRITARETGWPMLDKDTLTRPVVEAALEFIGCSPNDRESEKYLELIRPREYESLINAMTENVQCGNSAIITAPFIRELRDRSWIERMNETCESLNATLTVAWVYCDPETMLRYIRQRGAARDAAKLDNWANYADSIDVSFRPPMPHVVIDNGSDGSPLKAQAHKLIVSIIGDAA
ncbi:GntR family transcriptional regulator [Umezawaea sp. Da 62-37]|uniref:GntR family transcriptional regulator n=1 Tax=Umezawaea sp. Da 62-37 TaxID=3075927 RepID=UPI0028F6FD25|nr:GntR family transcriptional regulator [Umezawaea sp. Da 62-37]WNV83231.1 GntR family transcriptional regulator [Umezawaea sp. Da 62-37]